MITCDFNKKMGYIIVKEYDGEVLEKPQTLQIYHGNCYAVVVQEYVEVVTKVDIDGSYYEEPQNCTQLYDFWVDERHLKNVLGLSKEYKGKPNRYIVDGDFEFNLSTEYEKNFKIAQLLTKSGVKVNMYYEKEGK